MPEVVAKQFETAVSIGETALADLDRAQATARSTSADDAKQAEGEDADSLWQDVAGKLVAEQMGSQVSFSNTHVLQQTLKATARDMNEQHKTVRAPSPPHACRPPHRGPGCDTPALLASRAAYALARVARTNSSRPHAPRSFCGATSPAPLARASLPWSGHDHRQRRCVSSLSSTSVTSRSA